ncbi:MAG: inorganic phosphate transporter [Bacteroidales bacterium]|nr:inorganic phosphate transporter [Bacteroidales bacterium]
MEIFYIVIVAVLFILAISDLVVGVSNDAVNFLNSAIGSKAAPFRLIMIIAAAGILIGTTFSSGMMEVARKGIFHPEQFYFSEIMIIFLAVMITDVILLDLFNTFGLPTSTTVSIVFELLGAAVGVAIIKISHSPEGINSMGDYINSERALLIISGILLSVIIAFSVGAIVQYFSRLMFSFNYNKSLKWLGSIWGGLAITAITYFILLKGAKGISFLSSENLTWIQEHSMLILGWSFLFWTVLMQLLIWLFKINILKIIVLVGTFALAMAFAGNDLVNFIGVPLAGFESFKAFIASSGFSPETFAMDALQAKVKTPTLFLLLAGIIMVITLWLSKKARSVVKTSINLSDQNVVEERFESSVLARSLVRQSIFVGNFFRKIIPNPLQKKIEKRFDPAYFKKTVKKDKEIAFDLVRASVNLVVASILIAFATSLKLPLSTTYVTFMVAMGTSLADGAWDRESAVYRITGVITVIGGWFFTALSAFSAALVIALLISWGGMIAIAALIMLAVFFIYKTHVLHKKRTESEKKTELEIRSDAALDGESVYQNCTTSVVATLLAVSEIYKIILTGLINEKRKKLKKALKDVKSLNKEVKALKKNIHNTIRRIEEEESVESGNYYVQILDYLREIVHCVTYISNPVFDHVDNNHAPLLNYQSEDLKNLSAKTENYYSRLIQIITKNSYKQTDQSIALMYELVEDISKFKKKHLKQIKKDSISTRISLLYLDVLSESKNLLLYSNNLLKAFRDFAEYNKLSKIKKIKKDILPIN